MERAPQNGEQRRAATARRFRVFGRAIESDLDLPELVPSHEQEPEWTLRVVECGPRVLDVVLLGERHLGPETYSLWRTPEGLRLQYSHAGVFDLSRDGREIVWYKQADVLHELVRAIVLGPVLALSLELRGLLCLHGSAVAVSDKAIVFLGPKHHGKSTLATALTAAGARLIGDDLIAVASGSPPKVWPGVPSVRLCDDTVRALPLDEMCASLVRGVKTTASGFAERAFVQGELELAALYVLEPVVRQDGFTCSRTRLSSAAAAIGVAHQTKLADSLVGMVAAGAQLAAAAKLAASVPVWTLTTARDLSRLPAIVSQILKWHSVRSQ